MEITNTIVTRSAIQKAEGLTYHADYTEENGKMLRVQCNIFKMTDDTEGQSEFFGAVYLENGALSCSIPYRDDADTLFSTVAEMIRTILKTTPLPSKDEEVQMQEETQKTSR